MEMSIKAVKNFQDMKREYCTALEIACGLLEFGLASKIWQKMKEANIRLVPEHMSGYPFHHGEISSLGEKYLTENGITKEEYDLWFRKYNSMYLNFSPLANDLPVDMRSLEKNYIDYQYIDYQAEWKKISLPLRQSIMELVSDPVLTSLLSVN